MGQQTLMGNWIAAVVLVAAFAAGGLYLACMSTAAGDAPVHVPETPDGLVSAGSTGNYDHQAPD